MGDREGALGGGPAALRYGHRIARDLRREGVGLAMELEHLLVRVLEMAIGSGSQLHMGKLVEGAISGGARVLLEDGVEGDSRT